MKHNQRGVYNAVASHYTNIEYNGILKDYQQNGSSFNGKKYQFEQDPFSEYQNKMYKRALYGLTVYTPEEIKAMHWEKRKRIEKVHKKTQEVLNTWKQEVNRKMIDKLFGDLFPNAGKVKDFFTNFVEPDAKFENKLTFKDLKINKNQVVAKLILAGVLPINFFNQKEAPANAIQKKEVLQMSPR